MVVRRDFRRGSAAVSQKRLTSWFQFQPLQNTPAAGGTVIFTLNAAALALRPFTIVRSRFEAYVVSDQEAATELQGAAVGGAIVSDQASAIGVTAVPTPITDMSSDLWLFHQVMFNSVVVLSAASFANEGTRYSIDSKAMRKVDIGQDLNIVLEATSATGFSGATVAFGGRMLVKVN